RGHAPAVAAHQFGIVEDAEGVDQGTTRQAVVEAAVALQHLQELLQPGFGIAADDPVHAQQVAGAQVAGVGGDRRFQRRGRRRLGEQGGKAQARARPDRAVVGGEVGRQRVEQPFGLGRRAGLQQRQREVEPEFVLARFGGHGLAQARDLGVRIQRRGLGRRFLDRLARLDAVVLQELAPLALGQRALEAVEDLPVLDQEHGRDRTDLEGAGDLRLLLGIDLGQQEGAVVFAGELLEDRPEGLARAAPFGPEIDQDRHLQRLLQHFGFEACGGGVEDVGRADFGGHGRAAPGQRIPHIVAERRKTTAAQCRQRFRPGVIVSLALDRAQARRIALAAQGFADRRHATPTLRTFSRTLARTGVLQIDSVNVLQRAHYMPLYSRMGAYDTALLQRAAEQAPRRIVEYWAHVAAFMPVELWPVMQHRMRGYRERGHAWSATRPDPKLIASLLDEVRERGPSTARDLDDGLPRMKTHWGWNWSATKQALEYLFASGELAVAGRNGAFERLYD